MNGMIGWFGGNLGGSRCKSERNHWLVRWELEGEAYGKVKGMIGWFGGNLKENRMKTWKK